MPESRAVQRPCKSAAARTHVCPQRLRGRSPACIRNRESPRQRLQPLQRRGESSSHPETTVDRSVQGLRGRHRFHRGAARGAVFEGDDGTGVPPEDRTIPNAGRAEIQL